MPRRPADPCAPRVRAALLLALTLLLAAWGAAQPAWVPTAPTVRGEIGVAFGPELTARGERALARVGATYRARIEADAALGPLEVRAVAAPLLALPSAEPASARFVPTVVEAAVRVALGSVDVEAGRLLEPLASARLATPFSVEPVDDAGRPYGVWSARATLYRGAWRARAAALYRPDAPADARLGGVIRVRREFGAADLEARLVRLGGWAAGVGGSGRIDALIVYGEGWVLTDPLAARGALGVSGFAGDALWTAELAYAPPGAGLDARPRLLGAAQLPLGDGWNLALDGSAGLDGGSLAGGAGARLTRAERDHEVGLELRVVHGDAATRYALRTTLTAYR